MHEVLFEWNATNTEVAQEVADIPSEAAARRSTVCALGNAARAALRLRLRLLSGLRIASVLCELSKLSADCCKFSVHPNVLFIYLSVQLSDLLLHRRHWLDWDHRSCRQRRHKPMNHWSGQLACCNGGGQLAYAGIRRCHRIDF